MPDLDIRSNSLGELLGSLQSAHSASGSGTAVAITMAVAAACAHKALALTRKHRALSPAAENAALALQSVIEQCFESAARDAACFSEFLRAHDRAAAERLLDADRRTQQLGDRLASILGQLQGEVASLARGDLSCARRLAQAAAAVQAEMSAENTRAAGKVLAAD